MKKRKVCIIITTRGNYAKMKSVLHNLMTYADVEPQLIYGGSAILHKYGNIMLSVGDKTMPPHRVIHFAVEGENPIAMAKSAGLALNDFSTAFEDLSPDVVVVVADRFESLAIAMAACYMNIPVAHVEGGEVSGSIDESIRHAISKLAHIHFPATVEAAKRIERLGENPQTIFTVGCTSLDVIASMNLNDLSPLMSLQEKSGVGSRIDLKDPYLIVIQHPVTTEYEQNLMHVTETIRAIDELKINTIWIWPNMDAGSDGISKGIRIFRESRHPDHVHFFKSLAIEHYAPLLNNAACIVGNSSSGIRESLFLGTPSVNIGSRQSNRERGKNVIDVPYDCEEIRKAILHQVQHGRYQPDHRYGDGTAGEKMARVLRDFQFTLQKRITF